MKFQINITWLLPVLLMLCIGAEWGFAQTASEQAYRTGINHFNLGDYASAITTWENLLRNDPNYANKEEVWYSIARVAIMQKSQSGNDKAIEYLDKITSLKDVNGQYYGQSLFLIGETLFSQAEQRYDADELLQAKAYAIEAKKHFDLLLTEIPNSTNKPQVLFYQTQIAVKYLQSAVETKKYAESALDNNYCKFYYAWAIGQLGEEAKARSYFGEFISNRDPALGPMSLYELAHTYYRAGDYQKTLTELNSFRNLFPNDTPTVLKAWLNVQRLQAMCLLHIQNYSQAAAQMDQFIKQLESRNENPMVEDYIFLAFCHIKTPDFSKANDLISLLEKYYADSTFGDAIKFLRAAYFAETDQYQNAINGISPILDVTQNLSGVISFTKRPLNAETVDANKSGLSEEYYLRAASLLAICYAKSGNMPVADQVYNAMLQVSREMYGRYDTIRQRTLSQLDEIRKLQQAGITTPPTSIAPPTIITPSNPGTGATNVVTGSPGSVIQSGGSNRLTKVMSPAEQEREINLLQTRADYAKSNKEYIDDVLYDLDLLMNYNSSLTEYNTARVAILRGEMKYFGKNDTATAIEMSNYAYTLIMENVENGREDKRDTETFVRAARGLGRNAAINGDYGAAAQYFKEALATNVVKNGKYRSELRYRYGVALLNLPNIPNSRTDALGCFNTIDLEEKTSDYWSHAALQLALNDYINGDYRQCEKTIDELIEVVPDKAILDRVLFLKGELALKNKQWDIAADSFDAVRKYVPDSPLAISAAIKRREANRQMTQ